MEIGSEIQQSPMITNKQKDNPNQASVSCNPSESIQKREPVYFFDGGINLSICSPSSFNLFQNSFMANIPSQTYYAAPQSYFANTETINELKVLPIYYEREYTSMPNSFEKTAYNSVKNVPQKKEITIDLYSLDRHDARVQKSVDKIYSYLSTPFSDEPDKEFAPISSETKMNINPDDIAEFIRVHDNFSFGEDPIQCYKNALYEDIKHSNFKYNYYYKPIKHTYTVKLEKAIEKMPVFPNKGQAFERLELSQKPVYPYTESEILKMQNKNNQKYKLNETNANAQTISKDKKLIDVKNVNVKKDNLLLNTKYASNSLLKKKRRKIKKLKKKDIYNNPNYRAEDSLFHCNFCPCTFVSPQGLGGHMSRTHSSQSVKFQKKKEIRNNREPIRKLLIQTKIKLCENHNKNYFNLIKTKQGKETLKKLLTTYAKEYKSIRRSLGLLNKDEK